MNHDDHSHHIPEQMTLFWLQIIWGCLCSIYILMLPDVQITSHNNGFSTLFLFPSLCRLILDIGAAPPESGWCYVTTDPSRFANIHDSRLLGLQGRASVHSSIVSGTREPAFDCRFPIGSRVSAFQCRTPEIESRLPGWWEPTPHKPKTPGESELPDVI